MKEKIKKWLKPVLFWCSRYGFGVIMDSPCSRQTISLSLCTARPERKKFLNFRVASSEVEL